MRKVFVSYARVNKVHVDQLVGHLGVLGCQTWVDSSLHGGQEWWDAVLQQIAECDVFVAIISRDAINSKACRREFDWADALGKPVLPVAVEPVPKALPRRFSIRQIVDYSDPGHRTRAALTLAGGLATLPPAPPLPEPLPEAPAVPLSYLTDLVDLVSQPDNLDHDQQIKVLFKLQPALRSVDPEERRGGRDILERFSSRDDLYADVDRMIKEELETHVSTAHEPPPTPDPALRDNPAPPAPGFTLHQQPSGPTLAATQQRPPRRWWGGDATGRAISRLGVLQLRRRISSVVGWKRRPLQTKFLLISALIFLAAVGVSGYLVWVNADNSSPAALPPPAPPTPVQAGEAGIYQVTYSVTGTKAPGDIITVTYVDGSGRSRTQRNIYIPWSLTVTPISQSEVGSVQASSLFLASKLNCSITNSDEALLASNTSNSPQISC